MNVQLPPRIKSNSGKADKGRRSPAHRAWVRLHACSVPGCEGRPIECAHVRRGTDGAMSMKPSDAFCLSLCKDHHDEQHRLGEQTFEAAHGISMRALAERFYRQSPHRSKLEDPYQ